MPNFRLHWLVAWQALDALSEPARSGREAVLCQATCISVQPAPRWSGERAAMVTGERWCWSGREKE
jgi:hypothetical protein